ncbi:beta-galactosidase [Clostridium pasteurianum]|uniref:Beta-1,4-xylanase n=1 Tax=Clostridium pasteurianum BC1 TaxID=86416 RepID=R4JZW8_CLOPA|nr:beta-galactosidase [Clostridium pasteurianum]AGK95868.1 beta-1,4-xylanase [Clostridium pasteurianum BC1]
MLKNKKVIFLIVPIIIISIFVLVKVYRSINNNNSMTLTGVNIHSLGMKDSEIKKITGAGLKIVRIDLFWSSVEYKKGTYDFSKYDKFVNDMEKNNVKILFVLDYENKFYDDGLSPHTDEGRKAFTNFAKAAVERYRGKSIMWEIWNEPNGGFWHPKANWEDYFNLAMDAIKAIKSVDKDAFIAAPAASEVQYNFFDYLGSKGLFKYIDAVSVHPYRKSNPETVIEDYKNLKNLIENYPHNRNIKIFSGEWGYSTSWEGMSETKQAQYCIRQYLSNTISGVNTSIWYDWINDGNDKNNPEHNFGVMYSDSTPKPTYYAIKTMNETLKGYDYIKRVDTASKNDYVLMFRKGSKIAYAVWTTSSESHDINISVENNNVQIIDLIGGIRRDKASDKKYSINLDGSVKYILTY